MHINAYYLLSYFCILLLSWLLYGIIKCRHILTKPRQNIQLLRIRLYRHAVSLTAYEMSIMTPTERLNRESWDNPKGAGIFLMRVFWLVDGGQTCLCNRRSVMITCSFCNRVFSTSAMTKTIFHLSHWNHQCSTSEFIFVRFFGSELLLVCRLDDFLLALSQLTSPYSIFSL